jgi:hypothetical protein
VILIFIFKKGFYSEESDFRYLKKEKEEIGEERKRLLGFYKKNLKLGKLFMELNIKKTNL